MKKLQFYTPNEIIPEGWMRRQLEIQASGLSGNLHKVWRDIRNSAWIGGDADGWERVPYWLDGILPLAYLLKDEELIAVSQKYIDAILARQEEDGWICPCPKDKRHEYDPWAIILISKVLTVYYDCSGDERARTAVYRILKNFYDLLKSEEIKLFNWGKCRWFEAFISIRFTYLHTPEAWLLELARILRVQGFDYNDFTELWKKQQPHWCYQVHIVNMAMMLKAEALTASFLGEEYTDNAEKLYAILKEYNGTPVELFTGDECLAGLSPIHGTELCAVVEQMYSYQLLYACTGERKWLERMEVIAFNALPGTFSEDMWAHQYVQLSNQIACKRLGKSVFGTNGGDAHLFGLEPEFGCCTANMHQGFPKLALSAFMHEGDHIINTVALPVTLKTEWVTIQLETEYPFKNRFHYSIKTEKPFTFTVRIPSFAENVTVDGALHQGDVTLAIEKGSRTIDISYTAKPYLESRPYDLYTAKCGSLVFSLPIRYRKERLEYTANGVERKFPYCDYHYLPESDWGYGFSSSDLTVEECPLSDIPFSESEPAIVLKAKLKPIDWGLEEGQDAVCAKEPKSRTPLGEEKEVELYPYGSAKLRMTELPKV